jgi:O-antigen/teichoic acid export membrane protein
MKSNLLRDGVVYGVANALSAGVPFLLLPVLTRALSPGEYGIVVSFFMLVTISSAVAGLNVHGSVAVAWFERERHDFGRYVGSALLVAIASTAICAVALLGAGLLWQRRLGMPTWCWPLAAVYAGAIVVAGLRTSTWQSQRKPVASGVFQVALALLNAGLSLIAVLVLRTGARGRILGALAAYLLAAIVAVVLLRASGEAKWSYSRSDLRRLLRFGGPLIPHALAAALLGNADRLAVSVQISAGALGIYGAAAQMGSSMNVLGDALNRALAPWMYARMTERSKRAHLRVVGATYALIPIWLLLALLLWLAFSALGSMLLDQRYQAAIGLSFWFLLGGAMFAVYLSVSGLFFFTARTEWLSLATVSASVIAVVLSLVLSSRFGLQGAAAAYVSAQACLLVFVWILSTRVQPMPWTRPALALAILVRSH